MHSFFWEMYLCYQLLKLNFQVIPPRMKKGPDLHLVIDQKHVWIEATAPVEGMGDDAVQNLYRHSRFDPFPDEVILRFTNAIAKKRDKHTKYLEDGIVNPGDAYIIAINGGKIGVLLLETPPAISILKSVYPLGDLKVEINTQTGDIRTQFEYRDEINKKNKEKVSTKAFLDPAYSGISGILYSTAGLWHLPSQPGDEFKFIHNAFANCQMERGWLKVGTDYFGMLEGNQLKLGIQTQSP
jgi:type I restriction enzyme S subunit